jgi:hypothetical protein
VTLFVGGILWLMLFQEKPIFFGTAIYWLGTCFAILTTANTVALFGAVLVLMTFVVHTFFVYTSIIGTPYRDQRIGNVMFTK